MDLWLFIESGKGFMRADTNCIVFASKAAADNFINKAFGCTHDEIIEAQEIMQNWLDEKFQEDAPYPNDWCVKVFADGDQSDWNYMVDIGLVTMPYGLIQMEEGVPKMVIGQGSYSN